MDDVDDDPIVASYPIVCSSQLTPHLYLFQYPLRNKGKPYIGHSGPLAVRIKPVHGAIELDIPIDTTLNYNAERGVQFGRSNTAAAASAGHGTKVKKEEDTEEDRDVVMENTTKESNKLPAQQGQMMNIQTLSGRTQPNVANYAVGRLVDGIL